MQTIGIILLFSPSIAVIVRFASDFSQPDGISGALFILFRSRMIFIFGWCPFAVGIILFCIGTFVIGERDQHNRDIA